jgi:hypothetical protein
MFYVPLTDPKSWGADLPGTPVMLNPQFQGAPEPITEVHDSGAHLVRWNSRSQGSAVIPDLNAHLEL